MHEGIWQKSANSSFEVRGKTLGVVGYGNIGSQLGVLAEGLGMNVIFFDVVRKLNLGNARQVETLDDLLGNADVVSLHVPANQATAGMMGADELNRCKKAGVLINASRGNVVDLAALADQIRSGKLLGAALVASHRGGDIAEVADPIRWNERGGGRGAGDAVGGDGAVYFRVGLLGDDRDQADE